MTPTRGDVKTAFLALLDDPSGQTFTEAVFAPAFRSAYDALFNAFLQYQISRIELYEYWTLPAGATEATADDMGILDMGDFIRLSVKHAGETRFREIRPVEYLPQVAPGDQLGSFSFRDDTFFFVGATRDTELELVFYASGTAPTADNAPIRVDNSLEFLSNFAAGMAGPRKGYDATGARCMTHAVGPAYDQGKVGGELLRLVTTRVRSMQKQRTLAPRPFRAGNGHGVRRAVPYVEAQPGTTGPP
jgi:hypothetical protein